MKKFTFLLATLILLFGAFSVFAQKVVVIGLNHATPDGFSFVAMENIPAGEIIYFTEQEYSNITNNFNGDGESVVKFVVAAGGIPKGTVVFCNENSSNVIVPSGFGTATVSGSFSLASQGETFYAYADLDDDPTNGVSEIYSVLFCGSGEAPAQVGGPIPAEYDPAVDYPNAVVVHNFTSSAPSRTEYNPALRNFDVGTVDFTITGNWLNGQVNSPLSTTPFVAVSDPSVSVTVSPTAVNEDGTTNLVYTFTLSENATSNITVNYSVGGSAVFSSDYSQTGAATFGASSGTVIIANGTNSKSITIDPATDSDLEIHETVILTVNSGTGYTTGSPINATGTITNDDINSASPLVAITGLNHNLSDPDGFSFAALDNIVDGEIVYFTENSFDNATLSFVGSESVLKWTASGSVAKGKVIYIKETATNTFSVICEGGGSCGTITHIGGDFAVSTSGETFYAYSDVDNDHLNGITTIYSALYTSGGNIPASENPTTYYTNSILIDGFPAVEPNRTEYDPLKRVVDVSSADFSNISNWNHAQSYQDLSTVPFVAAVDPSVTVSISPSGILEDGGTTMDYTFTLSEVATGDLSISFNVSGTASFTSDYTQTGAATFSGSSGTVIIPNGLSVATVVISPVADTDVEPSETVVLTVSPGVGYVSGSPSSQSGTIINDDTNSTIPLVAITGLKHTDLDGFSFVAAKDIPAITKIYFTENSFNNTTLLFGSGEAVLSWTSPGGIVPAGEVIVVTETAPLSNSFSITRSGGSGDVGNIVLESGSFATATDGETFYAYSDSDNDPTNGVTDIYAVLYTGVGGSPGGTILTAEDPSGIYLNALVVDGFPATPPNRTEYDPTKRNVTVEAVNFKDVSNWLHAEVNQVLSTEPFSDLIIIASPELTTTAIGTFNSTSAVMGGIITNGGSALVIERGVVYSMLDNTPTIGEIDVVKDDNGTGSGVFLELIGPLMPNTTYYVQAYATNSVGTSYGGVESFTTSFEFAIWNGSLSNDWFTAGNWDGGVVPDADFNVIIPGDLTNYPTITAAAVCNGLILESTETSTASLLGQANLTVNEIVVIERFMSGNQWHMVSSPAPGQTIVSFLTANTNIPTKNVDDRGMIDYDEASDNWNDLFTSTQLGDLTSGKGFSLRTDADDVVAFFGTLETGTVSPSVTTSGNGWNCIGNPYSSSIFINDAADATNNFIDININEFDPSFAAIYVWEQDNDAYSIVNLGDAAFYAQLGQGFFVKAKTGVTEMQFTTAMQIHQPTAIFKSGAASMPEIKLIAKLDDHQSTTRIKFDDDMQTSLDIGYDAGIFKNEFDLYTQLVEANGVDFGVQYLPTSSLNNEEISLGLDSKYDGSVVFSSELVNISNDYQVVLEDRLTNTFTSLNDDQVYAAQVNENSQGKGRFYLHTSNSTTGFDNDNLKTRFTVYNDNDKIYINGQVQGKAVATLYDLMGRKMHVAQLEQTPLNYISTSNIKTGIYLLHIEYQGGAFNQKIPVNK